MEKSRITSYNVCYTKLLRSLFKDSCYGIENIKVEFFDEETLYIEFTGDDSALLIGKEGYRYKALSYILFNWINEKYGLMLRLEVAEFLKNQEEAIHTYLIPVIETINVITSYSIHYTKLYEVSTVTKENIKLSRNTLSSLQKAEGLMATFRITSYNVCYTKLLRTKI